MNGRSKGDDIHLLFDEQDRDMRWDGNLTHGNVAEKGGFADTLINGGKATQNTQEIKLAVATDEAVPSTIGEGEACPRAIDRISIPRGPGR